MKMFQGLCLFLKFLVLEGWCKVPETRYVEYSYVISWTISPRRLQIILWLVWVERGKRSIFGLFCDRSSKIIIGKREQNVSCNSVLKQNIVEFIGIHVRHVRSVVTILTAQLRTHWEKDRQSSLVFWIIHVYKVQEILVIWSKCKHNVCKRFLTNEATLSNTLSRLRGSYADTLVYRLNASAQKTLAFAALGLLFKIRNLPTDSSYITFSMLKHIV